MNFQKRGLISILLAIISVCFLFGNEVVISAAELKVGGRTSSLQNIENIRRSQAIERDLQLHAKDDQSSVRLLADQKDNEKKYWYTAILPVYPRELPKFLSLSMMMFWIVFVFTLTRDTKDALIVTNCGAEAIAFLKVYGVVPAAAGFMVLYAKLANLLKPRTLFYVTLFPFFAFYFAFAFILYPLRNVLHPLHLAVPTGGFQYAVNLLRYWTFSLYYIVSELWGSAGIPLLFWSCANDVIRVKEVPILFCFAFGMLL